MKRVVFDASVMLALLFREPLPSEVIDMVPHAVASAVNVAEVVGRLVQGGVTVEDARRLARTTLAEVLPLTEEHAGLVGGLWPSTRQAGLSLGDRSCLALGLALGAEVYTTDRAWQEISAGVVVRVVRQAGP